ncbi:MAG: alpha/beta hydrolase [Spirochaetales bacterium]|nr:alpha/beta hydrolase [Spirochaetales bacterium]
MVQALTTNTGKIFYEYHKGREDRTVILIHGFTAASFIWQGLFDLLVAENFSVLRYDLFGRGSSVTAEKKHDIGLYVNQLKQIIEALGIATKLVIVGFSMGGAIASHFCQQNHGGIEKLFLISPIMDGFLSFQSRILKIPVLGELLFFLTSSSVFLRKARDNLMQPENCPDFFTSLGSYIGRKSVRYSLLSTYRHFLSDKSVYNYEALNSTGLEPVIIWGTEDKLVPFACSGSLLKKIKQHSFIPIQGAGHCVVYENPKTVFAVMDQVLKPM